MGEAFMPREIYAYQCRKCGHLHYPYRMVCRNCGENDHNDFEPIPLPKRGKLLTFTHVHSLPADFEVPRLGLGIVELDNGIRITGQIRIDEPTMGMNVRGEVEIVRRTGYDEFWGMVFYAA
jgi:uncharacterized OB-fold protein